MQPFVQDADFVLYVGDVREVLAGLPDESVHCVVTSPPYWGLRDYGTGSWEGGDDGCAHSVGGQVTQTKDGTFPNGSGIRPGVDTSTCRKCGARRVDRQLGLEPTPELYVANMVAVFREVRRVLRRDGTVWLNIGDSYANDTKWGGASGEKNYTSAAGGYSRDRKATGLKPKDLVGIPWRLAFALQADGWYLRSEIIWAKPNPMPESVTDRPTKSHEQVFLLTRSPRYFYDADAVREPFSGNTHSRGSMVPRDMPKSSEPGSGVKNNRSMSAAIWGQAAKPPPQSETLDDSEGEAPRGPDGRRQTHVEAREGSLQHRNGERWPGTARNMRSVWEIATQPYPEAHFATYPEALVERCVKAGTSERGCCPECGAPWERETKSERGDQEAAARPKHTQSDKSGLSLSGNGSEEWAKRGAKRATLGWKPTCTHEVLRLNLTTGGPLVPVPCVVLDPFAGSGTTGLVARNLGRRSIAIELNETYAQLAAIRLAQQSLLTEAS